YGTKHHIEQIHEHGISPYHRKSFAPVKAAINNNLKDTNKNMNQINNQPLFNFKGIQFPPSLQAGQIVQGHILKLYPNHKAEIQIGLHKLIAQLEASLTLDERYNFQVQTTDNVIYLKVLGDKLTKQANQNGMALLKQLGLKGNKHHAAFLQSLIAEGIPFDIVQLKQA